MSRKIPRRVQDTYPVHMRHYIAQLNNAERRRLSMTPYIRVSRRSTRYFLRSSVQTPSNPIQAPSPAPAAPSQSSVSAGTSSNNQPPTAPANADANNRVPLKPQNVGTAEQQAAVKAGIAPNNTSLDNNLAGPSNAAVQGDESELGQYCVIPCLPPQPTEPDYDSFDEPDIIDGAINQSIVIPEEETAKNEFDKKDVEYGEVEGDESQPASPGGLDPENEPDPKRRKILYVAQTLHVLARANVAINRAYRNQLQRHVSPLAADLELSSSEEEESDMSSDIEETDTDTIIANTLSSESEEDIERMIAQIPIPVLDDDDEWNADGPPEAVAAAIKAIYPDEDENDVTPFIHSTDPNTRDAEMRAIEAIQKFQVNVHRLLDRNFITRHPPGAHLLPMHCIFISTMRSVFPVFLMHPDLLYESQNRVMDEISERRLFILKKLSLSKMAEDSDLTDNCVICQAEFEKDQTMRALRCGHKFHVVCIDNWCRTSLTCPVCRRGVDGHVLQEDEVVPVRAPLATLRSLEYVRTYLVMRRYSYNNNSRAASSANN